MVPEGAAAAGLVALLLYMFWLEHRVHSVSAWLQAQQCTHHLQVVSIVLGDTDGDGLGLTCWWQLGAEEEPAAS
jgi:hypothetical protein